MSSAIDLSALKGKSVLVTGGASGIGLAAVHAFAAADAYVTIADMKPAKDEGEKLAQELINKSYNVTYVHCDVTSWESQVQAFKTALMFAPNNTLDVVLMSAGVITAAGNLVDHVMATEPTLDEDPKLPVTAAIDVNLMGVYYSAFLALNYFRLKPRNQKQGAATDHSAEELPTKSLIFISSMAGYIDYPGHSTYNAGKFGVRGIFRSVRSNASKLRVRTNLIAPWYIDTPMTTDIKKLLAEMGLQEGKGFSFASIDKVTEAIGRCAVDEKVDGRPSHIPTSAFRACRD